MMGQVLFQTIMCINTHLILTKTPRGQHCHMRNLRPSKVKLLTQGHITRQSQDSKPASLAPEPMILALYRGNKAVPVKGRNQCGWAVN